MKKYILLIVSLFLCACSPISEETVEKRVASILSENVNGVKIAPSNKSKTFYRYYLPTNISLEDANETSAVLTKDNFDIVFNFNTSNLIINEYYTDLSEDSKQDVIFKSYTEESFKDLLEENLLVSNDELAEKEESHSSQNSEVDYTVKKSEKNDIITYSGYYDSAQQDGIYFQLQMKRVQNDYYLHLDGSIATFTSVVPAEEVDKVINSMIVILKSIHYDKDKILETYAMNYDLKLMEENFKESNDFIYQNLPSEGYLEDLINNGQ